MNVGDLINELKKHPRGSPAGFYPNNAYNRGDANWINYIESVELCSDKKTVALIGGFE